MKSLLKIIISHPTGNQNSRNAIKALIESNNLYFFITSLSIDTKKFILKILPVKIKKELDKRNFFLITDKIKSVAVFAELFRLILGRFFKRKFNNKDVLDIYKKVDKYTSTYISKNYEKIKAVYCYEDGALETFKEAKKHNIKCIYELPIGYWKAKHKINNQEILRNKKWGKTWLDYKDNLSMLRRKDMELKLSDYIIVPSIFVKKTLSIFPQYKKKIHILPYGFPNTINVKKKDWYNGKKKLRILYAGGLSQRKGISYVIASLKKIIDQNKKELITITFIGSGPAEELIKKELPQIIIKQYLSHQDVLKEMLKSDVLLFPSLFEGFGLVILEAMSHGMVVISTNRTGLIDVSQGNDSIIVKANSHKEIYNSLNSLLQNPSLVKKIGINAIKTAKNYNWSKYRARLNKIIKDV